MPYPYGWLTKSLDTLYRANWHRNVQAIESSAGSVVSLGGAQVINFASNDYLGLASHPKLIERAIA
ncbi:MAG: 8-amino-7-oxononanoate synthase, partial [Phormidesmis sp.]